MDSPKSLKKALDGDAEILSICVFGASGDLAKKKVYPAIFALFYEGHLPEDFVVFGYARSDMTTETFVDKIRSSLPRRVSSKVDCSEYVEKFLAKCFYQAGQYDDPDDFKTLATAISEKEAGKSAMRIFYLSIPPSIFVPVAQNAARHVSSLSGETRVIVEKPFGRDLDSSRELTNALAEDLKESQTYRIDHYLGKETVQNIMMFRFSNAIFEQLWNREAIEHVQITVSEDIGVGGRGGYFEEAGTLRDMMQNHLLQILSLVAMEPPPSLAAEDIRNEKVKLLKSIRQMTPEAVAANVVRGQYFAGTVNDDSREGYRQEETYVALKLFIDNWRWSGVPFYLRAGKNLPLRASEVRVQFRPTPNVLFAAQGHLDLHANALTLRLQPDEGIFLRFNGKVPGNSIETRPVRMHFDYDAEFGAYTPEAYERLLLEAMAGDATLFIRRDEVETAWQIVDDIRAGWGGTPLSNREFYVAGTWGPVAADDLLEQDSHKWHNPKPSKG